MRKQTKIAAVVSAAALLALGASITSFAAAKGTWMMTDGEWYCYDKNGDPYTETFCSSNGKEYYVGEDGAIVTSSWVDYAEGIYYVNSSGAKITSDWRFTTPYEDESADEEWYYFKSNGKRAENTKVVYKGNTYYFDGEGKMLTGWVTYEPDGSNQTVDEATGFDPDYSYYCDETGARVTSDWVKTVAPEDIDNNDADENWYYFKSTGKAATGRQNNVKGQTYFFDGDGVMLSGFVGKKASGSNVEYEELDDDYAISNSRYTEVYFCGGSSDGHMKKNKWILELAPLEDEDEDENKNYYWIKKNGVVFTASATASDSNAYEGVIYNFEEGKLNIADAEDQPKNNVVEKLNINGKYYYFNQDGEMLSGFATLNGRIYYFGGDNDGAMKTGAQNIKDDTDENYKFYFATKDEASKNRNKGEGITGKQGGKLYYKGMLITAEDYKYEIAKVPVPTKVDNVWVNIDRYYIINQSGSIQTSAKDYKEDDVVVIGAKGVEFKDYITKIGTEDVTEDAVAAMIQQGAMVSAEEIVGLYAE